MFCLMCLSFLTIQCSSSRTMPEDIAGKWVTDAQAYKGEFIEISGSSLVYGSENSGTFTYSIKKVKTEKGHLYNSTTYKIYCSDEAGDENLFTMIYTPDDGGTLRQKSTQDIIWKRSKP